MKPAHVSDLWRSRDGTVSLTKTFACIGHALVAIGFVKYQLWPGTVYDERIWVIYIGVAILHAFADKTAAQIQDVRKRHIDAEVQKVTGVAMPSPPQEQAP